MSEPLLQWSALWWHWLAPLAIQGTVLILLLGLLDRLLPRRTWPQLRAALWLMVLARLLLPPTVELPGPMSQALAGSAGAAWWSGAAFERVSPGNWALAVVGLWAIGLTLLATLGTVRFGLFRRALRRLPLSSEPAWLSPALRRAADDLGMKHLPRVRLSPAVASPFVTGLWRPSVYLPAALPKVDARHVLLHELAHVKRRDLWLAAFAAMVTLLYWFHPLVWWAKRQADALREQCCDRTVTRALRGDAAPYRRTLARFALARGASPMVESLVGRMAGRMGERMARPVISLGFLRPRNVLLARLEALRYAGAERPLLRRLATSFALVLGLAVALPMASSAERASHSVAEWIERPPGCLPLRLMVFQRLAAERALTSSSKPPSHEEN